MIRSIVVAGSLGLLAIGCGSGQKRILTNDGGSLFLTKDDIRCEADERIRDGVIVKSCEVKGTYKSVGGSTSDYKRFSVCESKDNKVLDPGINYIPGVSPFVIGSPDVCRAASAFKK